jgi:hypothetical protein
VVPSQPTQTGTLGPEIEARKGGSFDSIPRKIYLRNY